MSFSCLTYNNNALVATECMALTQFVGVQVAIPIYKKQEKFPYWERCQKCWKKKSRRQH